VWVTKYPWQIDPQQLPNNYSSVLATLKSTQSTLQKRGREWQVIYQKQIENLFNRGIAKQLSQQEIAHWKGAVFYISHLTVKNARSSSTPFRIVFNCSQRHRGISLNDSLDKGP